MNTTLPHFRINRREDDIITLPISESQCIIERGGIEFLPGIGIYTEFLHTN